MSDVLDSDRLADLRDCGESAAIIARRAELVATYIGQHGPEQTVLANEISAIWSAVAELGRTVAVMAVLVGGTPPRPANTPTP